MFIVYLYTYTRLHGINSVASKSECSSPSVLVCTYLASELALDVGHLPLRDADTLGVEQGVALGALQLWDTRHTCDMAMGNGVLSSSVWLFQRIMYYGFHIIHLVLIVIGAFSGHCEISQSPVGSSNSDIVYLDRRVSTG